MTVKASLPNEVCVLSHGSCDPWFTLVMAHRIIPASGRSIPATTEIVLHDLALLPNPIVAVRGNVSNCHVGDPPTGPLLDHVMRGAHDDLIGYRTYRQDGRQLQSSTIILRDGVDAPVGALCVNSDISPWITLQKVAEQMAGGASALETAIKSAKFDSASDSKIYGCNHVENPRPTRQWKEVFATNVDQLALHLIELAIQQTGFTVDEMRKEHKVAVVKALRDRGIFLLRDAAEIVASAIDVSRFTVYNYLKELDPEKMLGRNVESKVEERK